MLYHFPNLTNAKVNFFLKKINMFKAMQTYLPYLHITIYSKKKWDFCVCESFQSRQVLLSLFCILHACLTFGVADIKLSSQQIQKQFFMIDQARLCRHTMCETPQILCKMYYLSKLYTLIRTRLCYHMKHFIKKCSNSTSLIRLL